MKTLLDRMQILISTVGDDWSCLPVPGHNAWIPLRGDRWTFGTTGNLLMGMLHHDRSPRWRASASTPAGTSILLLPLAKPLHSMCDLMLWKSSLEYTKLRRVGELLEIFKDYQLS